MYDSIYNLPMWIWVDIHEKQDYTLLIKNKKRRKDHYLNVKKTAKIWEGIYDEYIFKIGVKKYVEKLKKRHEIASLRLEALETGDRFLNTIANIKEAELEELEKDEKKKEEKIGKVDFEQNVAAMNKMGYNEDPRTITVFNYFNNMKFLTNDRD